MTVPGFGNEPEGHSLKGGHRRDSSSGVTWRFMVETTWRFMVEAVGI